MYNTFYTNYMLVCVSPNDSLTFYSNSPLTTHIIICSHPIVFFFFFNDPAPTEISPFPLHAALPIPARLELEWAKQRCLSLCLLLLNIDSHPDARLLAIPDIEEFLAVLEIANFLRARLFVAEVGDRKSTRLNSSHLGISYAVFCLKKK